MYQPLCVINSLKRIKKTLEGKKSLVVQCSFGKDSMVLLDLVSKYIMIPFVFLYASNMLKDKTFSKYIKAMTKKYRAVVTVLYPDAVRYFVKEKERILVDYHRLPDGQFLYVPTKIIHSDRSDICFGKYLTQCQVNNINAEAIFNGQKLCDDLQYFKNKAFEDIDKKNGIVVNKGYTLCYPMYDWSDEQVWEYLKMNDIPVCRSVYKNEKKLEKWVTEKACCKCFGENKDDEIYCPSAKRRISNYNYYDEKMNKEAVKRYKENNIIKSEV